MKHRYRIRYIGDDSQTHHMTVWAESSHHAKLEAKKLHPKKGRGTGVRRAAAKKPLPLVGPITYYLPIKNGRPCREGLTGEWRLITQAEIRVVRGEFAGMDRFYAAIRKDGRNFLTAAGIAIFGAVGSNDPLLFDAVIKDIDAYPSRHGAASAR